MAGVFGNEKTGKRVLFGVVIAFIALSMLLYLVPQGTNTTEGSTDVLAKVGDQTVTMGEVRQQLDEIRRRNPIPKPLEGLYARNILNQLVFQRKLSLKPRSWASLSATRNAQTASSNMSQRPSTATRLWAWTLMPAKSSLDFS